MAVTVSDAACSADVADRERIRSACEADLREASGQVQVRWRPGTGEGAPGSERAGTSPYAMRELLVAVLAAEEPGGGVSAPSAQSTPGSTSSWSSANRTSLPASHSSKAAAFQISKRALVPTTTQSRSSAA